jgi:hypothetical protein
MVARLRTVVAPGIPPVTIAALTGSLVRHAGLHDYREGLGRRQCLCVKLYDPTS